ncbi:MAG: hypothetical protein WBL25_19645 [Anaerolineales bacterium]
MKLLFRHFSFYLFLSIVLNGCAVIDTSHSEKSKTDRAREYSCPVTEPDWIKPPEDSAVQGSPGYGYYFVNEDRSIWASAWWREDEEYHLLSSEDGIKVAWFRPEGATLEITGQRLDAQAPPLDAYVPCCYPTQFQATGLAFPTEGCWEVTATAADNVLSFIVNVEP